MSDPTTQLSDIWAGTTFETRDERKARLMSDRPIEDPETVKREERIRPGAVAEIQRSGQDMSAPTTAEQEPDLRAYGYAPGNYTCVCIDCAEQHTADKRARRCKDCAVEAMAEATTAETPTMQERLIETILANQGYSWFGRERAAKLVDAILREMLDPSDGMLEAANREWDGRMSVRSSGAWQAMIQHIINEPKD